MKRGGQNIKVGLFYHFVGTILSILSQILYAERQNVTVCNNIQFCTPFRCYVTQTAQVAQQPMRCYGHTMRNQWSLIKVTHSLEELIFATEGNIKFVLILDVFLQPLKLCDILNKIQNQFCWCTFRWDNHNHQLTDLDVVDMPSSTLKQKDTESNQVKSENTFKSEPSAFQKIRSPVIGFSGPNTSSRPQARNTGKLYITFVSSQGELYFKYSIFINVIKELSYLNIQVTKA